MLTTWIEMRDTETKNIVAQVYHSDDAIAREMAFDWLNTNGLTVDVEAPKERRTNTIFEKWFVHEDIWTK